MAEINIIGRILYRIFGIVTCYWITVGSNIAKAVDYHMKEQGFWCKCVNHALDKGVRDAMNSLA